MFEGHPATRFPTTHWSRIAHAGGQVDAKARAALEELCRDYWFPLYAFARRRGSSPHEAEDVVQGFFADLLERGDLAGVNQSKGRFRTFLRAACEHYLAIRYRELLLKEVGRTMDDAAGIDDEIADLLTALGAG
jgi:RNA polymerase sigma-70 factor (ECF subfamily)